MIDVWIDARCIGKYSSGFTVSLRYNRYHWTRSFNFGHITTNQTELKAIEYALKSIKSEFKDESVNIRSTGRYASLMLERKGGAWTREAHTNARLIEEVRKQCQRFKAVTVYYAPEEKMFETLREITDLAIKREQCVFDKN